MNKHLRNIIILITMGCFSLQGAHAGETKTEVLSTSQMASIQGGWCPLEICETPPGTATCQPIPANQPAICSIVKCTYEQQSLGRIVIYGCVLTGEDTTCSGVGFYRQCIWAFQASICSYSDLPTCGLLVQGDCLPDVEERVCVCAMETPGTVCGWTNCLP